MLSRYSGAADNQRSSVGHYARVAVVIGTTSASSSASSSQ
ncbi:hypothetical protein PVAP13_6KG022050 [Panicum virgatum]|uniref:Uncharacterized protein n=1 Tax=Panicum virgatum TaxID=38727 RepID=A0A8T0R827_PANVG|nr:hypothetical protein PVAP13_6KG022050 [Panicum virgatum]